MNALIVAVILGLLVSVHELGHLVAARLAGVPVARFSVGLGPRLWSVRWRGTEYQLGVIPLGGYVMPAVESEEDYLRIARAKRVVFALGGPVMNVLAAYALFVAAAVAAGERGAAVLVTALDRTITTFIGMFAALPALFSQPEQLSSVVGIVTEGARFASAGAAATLALAGVLSLNLAVINLLPLPPLDGGKVLLCALERVHARAARLHLPLSVAGWVLLLGVFLYATAQDVARLI